MKGCTHLIREQRYRINAYGNVGLIQRETPTHLHVHKSTISWEIGRDRGRWGYQPLLQFIMDIQNSVLEILDGFLGFTNQRGVGVTAMPLAVIASIDIARIEPLVAGVVGGSVISLSAARVRRSLNGHRTGVA